MRLVMCVVLMAGAFALPAYAKDAVPASREQVAQYADKLLSEIEATLAASLSRSAFPKFKPDISPAQAKVVQDYISGMRAQLLRILDSQGVPIPAPLLPPTVRPPIVMP